MAADLGQLRGVQEAAAQKLSLSVEIRGRGPLGSSFLGCRGLRTLNHALIQPAQVQKKSSDNDRQMRRRGDLPPGPADPKELLRALEFESRPAHADLLAVPDVRPSQGSVGRGT